MTFPRQVRARAQITPAHRRRASADGAAGVLLCDRSPYAVSACPCVPAFHRLRRHLRSSRCPHRSTLSADYRRCMGAESGADAASRRDRVHPRVGSRAGSSAAPVEAVPVPGAAPWACRQARARASTTARVEQLTGDARTPPSRLTIIQKDTAIAIADDQGHVRTFRPDGHLESLTIGTVPLPTTARWVGPSLVVVYDVATGRQLRYTYTSLADPTRLQVNIRFLERGREGDEVRLPTSQRARTNAGLCRESRRRPPRRQRQHRRRLAFRRPRRHLRVLRCCRPDPSCAV